MILDLPNFSHDMSLFPYCFNQTHLAEGSWFLKQFMLGNYKMKIANIFKQLFMELQILLRQLYCCVVTDNYHIHLLSMVT